MLAAGAGVEGCAIGLAEKHKPICIYEMMGRIGLETGGGALPRFGLNYASAMRRCERCARPARSSLRCGLRGKLSPTARTRIENM
jgi:hypothetical protein